MYMTFVVNNWRPTLRCNTWRHALTIFVVLALLLVVHAAPPHESVKVHIQASITPKEDSTHAPGPWLTPIEPVNLTSCEPQLLGIGAQKAGTDYFYGWVRAVQYHPQLLAPKNKELHFFNRQLDRWHSERSFGEYLKEHFGVAHYDSKTKHCRYVSHNLWRPSVRMEITPMYIYHPLVPARVKQYLPEARLVLILRDPTARTLSNFNHNWHIRTLRQRNMQLTGDAEVTHYVELFNHTLMAEVNVLSTCFDRFGGSNDDEAATAVWRCLQLDQLEVKDLADAIMYLEHTWRSIYADHIVRWLESFPPQRLLIWITEDFIKAPHAHMQQMINWLGLDPAAVNTAHVNRVDEYKHVQPYLAPAPEALKSTLQRFLKPHTQRLLRLLESKGYGHQASRATAVWPTLRDSA